MDARSALPRRVVLVEERNTHRSTVPLGEQALKWWLRPRHLIPQNVRRDLHGVLLALVLGKASDQELDSSRIPGCSEANRCLHGSSPSIRHTSASQESRLTASPYHEVLTSSVE